MPNSRRKSRQERKSLNLQGPSERASGLQSTCQGVDSRQAITNLIGYYGFKNTCHVDDEDDSGSDIEADTAGKEQVRALIRERESERRGREQVKESWIELLEWLRVFDFQGRPLCKWHYYDLHPDRRVHCLKELKDTKGLCRAYRDLHFKATDPLIDRQGDCELMKALFDFVGSICCDEHNRDRDDLTIIAEDLLPIVKKWRKRYVFRELPTPALPQEEETESPRVHRPLWPLGGRKPSNKQQAKQRRNRSTSSESIHTESPTPTRPMRPVSSAYDILNMAPNERPEDWSVHERGKARKRQFASAKRATLKLFGRVSWSTTRNDGTDFEASRGGRPLSTLPG